MSEKPEDLDGEIGAGKWRLAPLPAWLRRQLSPFVASGRERRLDELYAALLAALPPPGGEVGELVAKAWRDLVEKDDRTSPAEYPEMCLITYDELADYIASALSALAGENERLKGERDAAILSSSEWARKAGEAEGRLKASEWPGVIDDWQEAKEKPRPRRRTLSTPATGCRLTETPSSASGTPSFAQLQAAESRLQALEARAAEADVKLARGLDLSDPFDEGVDEASRLGVLREMVRRARSLLSKIEEATELRSSAPGSPGNQETREGGDLLQRLALIDMELPDAPWEVWTSCSYRRIKGRLRSEGRNTTTDVLSAYNQRCDGHPDLSMPEDQLRALVALRNILPELIAALSAFPVSAPCPGNAAKPDAGGA